MMSDKGVRTSPETDGLLAPQGQNCEKTKENAKTVEKNSE